MSHSGDQLPTRCAFSVPEWLPRLVGGWPGDLDGVESRMALAIALSRENVKQSGGGPFGAIAYDLGGKRVLAAGVNLVTAHNQSCAHAEIVAISLAQQAAGNWNLADVGPVELVTSCEPCAMCYGAVPWSGVRRLVCGARKEDAESAGFDEGHKPDGWRASLAERGIEVECDVLRDEAAEVLEFYKQNAGVIYNP